MCLNFLSVEDVNTEQKCSRPWIVSQARTKSEYLPGHTFAHYKFILEVFEFFWSVEDANTEQSGFYIQMLKHPLAPGWSAMSGPNVNFCQDKFFGPLPTFVVVCIKNVLLCQGKMYKC